VVYDPNYFATNEYNTNYLTVIDIADKTDFTVEIANGQPQTLLEHAKPGIDSITTMYSTTAYTAPPSPLRGNGVIGVYVVNELTTPNSTVSNDIEINVFVSMGDDFEVFVPDDHFQYFVCKPQMGFEAQSGSEEKLVSESQNTQEPSAPQQDVAETLGPTMSDNSDINKVFTGESITSFRTMLKRYNLWNAISSLSGAPKIIYGRLNMYPYFRGNVAGAVDQTDALAPYNYCNTILLHWCTWAFSGWRGSIRYKFLLKGPMQMSDRLIMYVQRHPIGEAAYRQGITTPPNYLSSKQVAKSVIPSYNVSTFPNSDQVFTGMKGQIFQSGWLNPNIEFECPYYSPYRFTPGKEEDLTNTANWNEGFDYFISLDGATSSSIDIHVSAGEDFQLYFFTGLPRLYYEASAPV